jgi:hypothetical protein
MEDLFGDIASFLRGGGPEIIPGWPEDPIQVTEEQWERLQAAERETRRALDAFLQRAAAESAERWNVPASLVVDLIQNTDQHAHGGQA